MIIRAKAPLRLGLAGGGTDVSPYSDMFGGLVLNATINMYAYCMIEETSDDKITFCATDIQSKATYDVGSDVPIDSILSLHSGVYNRLLRDFYLQRKAFKLTTFSDAPAGSGLGSSSTMVVAILKAFVEWYNLPLGEYDIAKLAYSIEREDLQLSGGKQDQYAATFGGFNFMEFSKENQVIINPLRIKRWIVDELESSMLLFYTGASRSSAKIIDEQKKNASSGNTKSIEAMHKIRKSALDMKQALLKGDVATFGNLLGSAWLEKKKMASSISNETIESIFKVALANGALHGKVSGAGGGGFIMFMIRPEKRVEVTRALNALDSNGYVVPFAFSEGGCHGWKIY